MKAAPNTGAVLELLRDGIRPEFVGVTFCGETPFNRDGFDVYPNPGERYEWQWVRGLDVVAFAKQGQLIADALRAIANAKPNSLHLWDVDRRIGAEVLLDFPASHERYRSMASAKAIPVWLMPWDARWNTEFLAERRRVCDDLMAFIEFLGVEHASAQG